MSYAALIWGQRENIHIRRILTLQKQAFLKPGLLKLPKVSSVLFGNNSFRYQSILSWNLLQNYLAINDMSTLALGRLKYLIKFYFLSSHV